MSKDRLRGLIQDVCDTHAELHREIRKGERWQADGTERNEIVTARDRFNSAFELLFSNQLDPLRASFLEDPLGSVDRVIDFLEIDIPAFRVGYEKEWYLTKLKAISLTPIQRERLKSFALYLVQSGNYRREFRDWTRLMIGLADKVFVARLTELGSSSEDFTPQAQRMLGAVIANRKDLSAVRPANDS